MKKLILSLSAVTIFSTSALALDEGIQIPTDDEQNSLCIRSGGTPYMCWHTGTSNFIDFPLLGSVGGVAQGMWLDSSGKLTKGTFSAFKTAAGIADISLPLDQSQVAGLSADLSAKQPASSSLTAISGLSGNNKVLATNGSGNWALVDQSSMGFSGAYADLTGKPTIPTKTSDLTNDSGFVTSSIVSGYLTSATAASTYTPLTRTVNGQALSSNVSITTITGNSGTATALASNGSNCSAGNYPLGVDASGNAESCTAVPGAYTYTETTSTDNSRSLSTSTGAVGWQPSSTKPSKVCYLVKASTTASIGGPSVSTVNLEVAPTNSATAGDWVISDQLSNDQTITLAVVLQSVQAITHNLCADVPTGYYVKLRNTGSGTHTETFISGWKTVKG